MANVTARLFSQAMDRIAPLELAEPWDNVGLLAGDPDAIVTRVLLTIDCTNEVLDEAAKAGADAIVSYHPPIFAPLKRVVAPSLAYRLVSSKIAVFSPHTALDCALGGTNDALADLIEMRDRTPLVPRAAESAVKLMTFVPEANIETVSDALFAAGAGKIGAYRECSFRSAGTGTFFGDESSNPRVGTKLQRERVAETKLEVLVATAALPGVIAALRAAHPYEEPAIDLLTLAPLAPMSGAAAGQGQGRIGSIDADRKTVIARVRSSLGLDAVLVAGPLEGKASRAAVLAGSAGDLLSRAMDRGADLVLTGEVRHHDALAAATRGVTVICTLHSNSERLALPALSQRLLAELSPAGPIDVQISQADRDPFRILSSASSSS